MPAASSQSTLVSSQQPAAKTLRRTAASIPRRPRRGGHVAAARPPRPLRGGYAAAATPRRVSTLVCGFLWPWDPLWVLAPRPPALASIDYDALSSLKMKKTPKTKPYFKHRQGRQIQQRGPLEASGRLWAPLGASGGLWGPLWASGGLWAPLGASGRLWGPLGGFWGPLGASGGLWGPVGGGLVA